MAHCPIDKTGLLMIALVAVTTAMMCSHQNSSQNKRRGSILEKERSITSCYRSNPTATGVEPGEGKTSESLEESQAWGAVHHELEVRCVASSETNRSP